MDLTHFSFYRQGIITVPLSSTAHYELLLRQEGEAGNTFPKGAYESFIKNHDYHKSYSQWLENTLKELLYEESDNHYTLNLDHQELEYEETFTLLENLKPYRKHLSIEITETPVYDRSGGYFHNLNIMAFKYIASLGYKIALDDVTQGVNSIGNLLTVLPYISRVKFSLVHFKSCLNNALLVQLLLFLREFCNTFDKEMVVEGIENETTAQWLLEHNITIHQGYYYDLPSPIPKIKQSQVN